MPRLLDLFSGRWGWSRAFAARGWECVGVDLAEQSDAPPNCRFVQMDILHLERLSPMKPCQSLRLEFDFIVASSPCEQFSCHGMKNFQPNAPHPEMGIRLFNHTRALCEASGLPYVMENVARAQDFVGPAVHHAGSFYLWGNAVPPLIPNGLRKGLSMKRDRGPDGKRIYAAPADRMWSTKRKAIVAEIPPFLANCVADYAEALLRDGGRLRRGA